MNRIQGVSMTKHSARMVAMIVTFSQIATLAQAQAPGYRRSTPGANLSSSSAGSRSLGNPGAPMKAPNTGAKIGDYVELDEAIRNEMYGTIDFPNAELKDIVKAISKLATKNFILDRKLENRRVTILSPEAVTKQEAYNAFLSALYMNDLTVVSMGKFLKVIEAKSALQSNIRVFHGDYAPASEEIVTTLYPLKYLNAEEIQRFLVDLVPRAGRITAYPNTNTLVMTDTGLNIRRIISVLKNIDVPGHEDQLENIPIRYASAKGIAQLIDDILDAQSGGASRRTASRGPQKTRGGGIITKIVPDERTNSLVVLANGRGVQELKNLVSKLDTPNTAGSGNIHIYYVKNAVAEELAATINSLISGNAKPANPVNSAPPGISPLPTSPIASTPSSRRGDSDGIKLEGNIKVTADKATNALVVVGSSADFSALKSVLKKLDIPRRQVYVEATIMEISADNNFEFGMTANVAAPNVPSAGGFFNGAADFTKMATGTASLSGVVAGFTAGRTYQYNVPGLSKPVTLSTVTGLIKALQTTGQGTIMHQPQILTTDNQDAEIKVIDKVPTSTQTVTNSNPPTTATQIEKNNVEISLKITPQIGENSDLIKLKVDQSIDDFAPVEVAGQSQIQVTQRKANTTVVVRNGDTVVIGGLQKTVSKDNRSKFPLLGDLPILGWLFKYSTSQSRRSDLVLFLTPHVINEYSDLVKITASKLDEREEFGKKLYDPKDRGRTAVTKLREKNRADAEKAPPRSWGFKPKHEAVEDAPEEDSGSDEPASANATIPAPRPEELAAPNPRISLAPSTDAPNQLLNSNTPPPSNNLGPDAPITLEVPPSGGSR